MNRIQEVILDITGVGDELTSLKEQNEELASTVESVDGQNRLLIRQIEDLDYLNLYDVANITEVIPSTKRKDTLLRLRRLRHENPLAKQGVKLIVRFTLGKGIQWTTVHPAVREVFREFWRDPENQAVLTTHEAQKELLDETIVDGEKFLAGFSSGNAPPYVKLAEIPVEEIEQIIYDPNNRKIPVWYKRRFTKQQYDGNTDQYKPQLQPETLYYLDHTITKEKLEEIGSQVKIPAKKIAKDESGEYVRILHIYINPLWTRSGKRGVSELYTSREWLRVFKEFMENRAAINAAATTIALKRKIKGGPAEVAKFKNKLGDLDVGFEQDNELRKLTRPVPAAIYDSNPAVDIDWMKTDTGASQAKEDARMLLMVAGAGMATNIHYFGEGGDANLATAQAMELPMVKAYEDWQTWFKQAVLTSVARFVLHVAFPDGLPKTSQSTEAVPDTDGDDQDVSKDTTKSPDLGQDFDIQQPEELIAWAFPPIIMKDIVKIMTGYTQLVSIVARDNLTAQMAAIRGALGALEIPNLDQLLPKIEAEQNQLHKERQEQKELQRQQFLAGGVAAVAQNGKNGKDEKYKEVGFAKAQGKGLDADTIRISQGKPPLRRGKEAEDDVEE